MKQILKNLLKSWKLIDLCACVLSAALLVLSFPRHDYWLLAWVGLIPLFFSLDNKSFKQSFHIAYVTGVLFFACTLYWVGHVTIMGTICMVLYCAVYFGLFGLWYAWIQKEKTLVKLLLIPSGWTALEYLRSIFLSGFSWESLCLSQYKNLVIIQIADIGGMFIVSFLIVAVNFVLKEIMGSIFLKNKQRMIEAAKGLIVCVAAVIFTIAYGQHSLGKIFGEGKLSVAVVQANIPQEKKWDSRYWPEIMQQYENLIWQAGDFGRPQLIVLPETAFPGVVGVDHQMLDNFFNFVLSVNEKILFGAIVKEGEEYHNSALQITEMRGRIVQYNKIHLVPFGEYIPFRSFFPFLGDVIPIADFIDGTDFKLFPLFNENDQKEYLYSVMICFEDTIPWMARRFADKGAHVLINITNDAWFKDSVEPYMHLQSSVFRAVETRRYVVRAANTGISGFITPHGKMENMVQDSDGKMTFVEGVVRGDVTLNTVKSIYTKFGDLFTLLYFGCIIVWIVKKRGL